MIDLAVLLQGEIRCWSLLGFNLWKPRQNFSLQYQYNIKQTSDENKEKYKLADYQLIQNQILQTHIIRIVLQTVRRIINEILRVKSSKC